MSVLTDAMRDEIRGFLPRYPTKQAVVLPALHVVNETLRHVPQEAIPEIAAMLELAPAEVQDTLSFYGFFKSAPMGRLRCWVCRSISCSLRGGEEVLAALSEKLGVEPGGKTADGAITLEFAECLGACDHAPAALAGETLYKNITMDDVDRVIEELRTQASA